MSKNILITLIITVSFLVFFFYPKESMKGGVCPSCYITECDCIGYEAKKESIGSGKSICYGVVHSCMKRKSMD